MSGNSYSPSCWANVILNSDTVLEEPKSNIKLKPSFSWLYLVTVSSELSIVLGIFVIPPSMWEDAPGHASVRSVWTLKSYWRVSVLPPITIPASVIEGDGFTFVTGIFSDPTIREVYENSFMSVVFTSDDET